MASLAETCLINSAHPLPLRFHQSQATAAADVLQFEVAMSMAVQFCLVIGLMEHDVQARMIIRARQLAVIKLIRNDDMARTQIQSCSCQMLQERMVLLRVG
jgi:hypothetical protein